MLSLLLNGQTLPAGLLANVVYNVVTLADGRRVVPTYWAFSDTDGVVESGRDTDPSFTPLEAGPCTLYVRAVAAGGHIEERLVGFNVTAFGLPSEIGIRWNQGQAAPGRTLRGTILVGDPQGQPPRSLFWTLYRNNQMVSAGSSLDVAYNSAPDGLYRLKVSAVDANGQPVLGESTVAVTENYEQQGVNPIADPAPSLVLLGEVYTDLIVVGEGTVSELPYKLSSSVQELVLPPGTTHVLYALADGSSVDDEVVVRAKTGNWTLVGFPSGLHAEAVGYDYQPARIIPAPADLRLRLTLDAFNVHSVNHAPSVFRVKVVCYRQSDPVYRYAPCANSLHPGGAGLRERRWVVLPTALNIQPDAVSTLNRNGVGDDSRVYTATEATTVPLMGLDPLGSPYPVDVRTGYAYTDANWFATYESPGLPDIQAWVVAGLESGVRPAVMSLVQPGNPVFVERVKRLGGNLAVYLNGGAVNAGSTIRVTVETGLGVETFAVPVTADVYNAEPDVFQKVGVLPVDLADYQFSRTGLVFHVEVEEPLTSAGTEPAVPSPGPDEIYTTTRADTVVFDGACYSGRELVGVFAGTLAVSTSAGTGCGDPACGPVGLYCYTSVCDGTGNTQVFPQPLGFPSPFVALASSPFSCFSSPVFLIYGTGSFNSPPLVGYDNGSFCGQGYGYVECNGDSEIVVVYPCATSPHSVVEFGSICYALEGAVPGTGTHSVVTASEVTPVASCSDVVCTGSNANGSSYVYFDVESGMEVPVAFDHLELGLAHYGVGTECRDYGIPGLVGSKTYRLTQPRELLIASVPVTAEVRFSTNVSVAKAFVIVRNGALLRVVSGQGSTGKVLSLVQGDAVYLELGNPYGGLSNRLYGRHISVAWEPRVDLPRVYDTVVYTAAESGPVLALGFCGLSSQSGYEFYGTLPVDLATAQLPNPGGIVTVVSGGQELALIRSRSLGSPVEPLPSGVVWYSGQSLGPSYEFRFYTHDPDYGAHGEMDVWLGASGTFPGYLKMSDYVVVASGTASYRKDTGLEDTSRNALRVVDAGRVGSIELPSEYVGPDGRLIVVATDSAAVRYQGVTYSKTRTDTGISYDILPEAAVSVLGDYWLTADGTLPWLTDDGEPWIYV